MADKSTYDFTEDEENHEAVKRSLFAKKKTVTGLFTTENNGRNLLALRTTTDLVTPPESPIKQQTESCASDELESDENSEQAGNSESDVSNGTELQPRQQHRATAFEAISTSIGEILEQSFSRPAMSTRKSRAMQPIDVANTPKITIAEIHEEPASKSGGSKKASAKKASSHIGGSQKARSPSGFKCTVCRKTFSNRQIFTTHMGAHDGGTLKEKDGSATKQKFKSRMKPKNPVTSRTTEDDTRKTVKKRRSSRKGGECDICSRKFRITEKMMRHVKCHDNMKYQCLDPCTWMFDNRDELYRHLAQVHKTKLSRQNEARFMVNPTCVTRKHNEKGSHPVVKAKGQMEKKKKIIEDHQGSSSEDELDQTGNISGVASKRSLLNINAVRKGCFTYTTMSRLGIIPNQENLPDDLIRAVQTKCDNPYSVPSTEQDNHAKDESGRQSTDVFTDDETNEGAVTEPLSEKAANDQENELPDDDSMSIEIPYGDADYLDNLADEESDVSDPAETTFVPKMKSQFGQKNAKNFSPLVVNGTSSESESDREVSFKNANRMFSNWESESDCEVSLKRNNNRKNGKENEENNSLQFIVAKGQEEVSDNESISSCARARVFKPKTVNSFNESSSVEIVLPDTPSESTSSAQITSTPSRATSVVPCSPTVVPSTSTPTPSSSDEGPERRKRSLSESDGNNAKKSKTENADEECCLLALVDSFTRLSREGTCVVKQEILRILCNIEFYRSTPSVQIFHVRSLLQNRSSAVKSSFGRCDRENAERFCFGEVVPVLKRLDKRRRKLAALEIQRILFNFEFEFPK